MAAAPELIDSHCHLDFDYSPKTAADLVREAAEAGVTTLITVGTEIPRIGPIAAISEAHPRVFHTVGVHPHDAAKIGPGDLATLESAARHPKCVAVGEIGLDYYYDNSPREAQKAQLEAQLELAGKLALPVVIHARDAEEDLLAALTRHASRAPKGRAPGVIHCFTGTRAFGEGCLALGYYISFSGILTFKTAEPLRECARAFPLERLLVETDSPFLAPVPYRGAKCEPRMVVKTAEKIAEVKGLTLEEVARATAANTRSVFRLS